VEHRDREYGGDVIRAWVGAVDEGVLHDEAVTSKLCGLGEAGPAGGEECCPGGQFRGLEGYAGTGNWG
jgi:hypothetical protein